MHKIQKLGAGSYGTVYLAVNKEADDYDSSEEENYKAIKRNFKDKTASWFSNLRELSILNNLKGHPFIVELENISIGDPFINVPFTPIDKKKKKKDYEDVVNDNIHFVMEYVPN